MASVENKRIELYDLLKTKHFNPVGMDKSKPAVKSQFASEFNFEFKHGGKKYGTFKVAIDDSKELVIFFNKNAVKDVMGPWSKFIKELSDWGTTSGLNGLRLEVLDNYDDYIERRDSQKLDEAYHGTKYTSYSESAPATVRMIIRHNKAIGESDQRYRHVDQIFVENELGERFVLPTKKPSEGYAFARLIAEGGNPYDERGKHISQMCEDIKRLGGFLRATKTGQFNESVQQVITEAINHYVSLRETMKKLKSSRGFRKYFENWTPTLMEQNTDTNDYTGMFTKQHLDPRIQNALPVLGRLGISSSVMEQNFQSAHMIDEDVSAIDEEQQQELIKLLSSDDLYLGPDASNAIGKISDYIEDEKLFDRLRKAATDPNNDATDIVIGWMKEHSDVDSYAEIISKVEKNTQDSTSAEPVQAKSAPQPPTKKPKSAPQPDKAPPPPDNLPPPAPRLPESKNDELSRIRKLSGLV